jgi:glucose-6-phosphate isomerase, archaeal
MHLSIDSPSQQIRLSDWQLSGIGIIESVKKLGHLTGVFADTEAFSKEDVDKVIYKVQAHLPVKEGSSGGLFFGNTTIFPGKIGKEYYMTRGHFHALADRTEYYWCIQGEGMLLLMDKDRNTNGEKMSPGSLHFIKGYTAHRVANTGNSPLIFGACWPSDAGHNYAEIDKNGFSARLLEIDGNPQLV